MVDCATPMGRDIAPPRVKAAKSIMLRPKQIIPELPAVAPVKQIELPHRQMYGRASIGQPGQYQLGRDGRVGAGVRIGDALSRVAD